MKSSTENRKKEHSPKTGARWQKQNSANKESSISSEKQECVCVRKTVCARGVGGTGGGERETARERHRHKHTHLHSYTRLYTAAVNNLVYNTLGGDSALEGKQ